MKLSSFKGIPVTQSGSKFRTEQGFSAIKNGVKSKARASRTPVERKPSWIKAKMPSGPGFQQVRENVREHRLATVCEESMCPNIGECWNNGTATLMIMGSVCTRACQFCAVDTGNPRGWLDTEEPVNSARSVQLMGLRYVVITSVDRDDLPVLPGSGDPVLIDIPEAVTFAEADVNAGLRLLDSDAQLALADSDSADFDGGTVLLYRLTGSEATLDAQRGAGVFDKSIVALQQLNALGYGRREELQLNLVYNPQGPSLPPSPISRPRSCRA